MTVEKVISIFGYSYVRKATEVYKPPCKRPFKTFMKGKLQNKPWEILTFLFFGIMTLSLWFFFNWFSIKKKQVLARETDFFHTFFYLFYAFYEGSRGRTTFCKFRLYASLTLPRTIFKERDIIPQPQWGFSPSPPRTELNLLSYARLPLYSTFILRKY